MPCKRDRFGSGIEVPDYAIAEITRSSPLGCHATRRLSSRFGGGRSGLESFANERPGPQRLLKRFSGRHEGVEHRPVATARTAQLGDRGASSKECLRLIGDGHIEIGDQATADRGAEVLNRCGERSNSWSRPIECDSLSLVEYWYTYNGNSLRLTREVCRSVPHCLLRRGVPALLG